MLGLLLLAILPLGTESRSFSPDLDPVHQPCTFALKLGGLCSESDADFGELEDHAPDLPALDTQAILVHGVPIPVPAPLVPLFQRMGGL